MTLPFIPKENPDMPDAYGVEITLLGCRPESYEVVDHALVDKVYNQRVIVDEQGNKKIAVDLVGVHAAPFWEFILKDNDESLVIPAGSAKVKFDSRWYKMRQLKKETKKNDNL